MKIAAVTILLLTFYAASGQEFSSRLWHEGWLVTMSGDTLKGEIKYDMPTNAVQLLVTVKNQRKILTYSSKKVMYFRIFDKLLKDYRQFYSIPYKIRSDYKAPVIFDVLYEGPMTLLTRERIVVENDPYQSFTYGAGVASIERLVFTYYFVDKSGKIVLYEGGKGEIFEIFSKHEDKVREYIRENRLQVDEMRDLVRITAFYNSL